MNALGSGGHPPTARGRRSLRGARTRLGLGVVSCLVLTAGVACGDDESAPTPLQHFASAPRLQPPVLTIDNAAPATTPAAVGATPAAGPAYAFVAPWRGEHQAGPMIIDGRGDLVWFHPLAPPLVAMDFRAQRYDGRPVLTWWEGEVNEDGYGVGEFVIADRSYQEVARFDTLGGRWGDFHEFLLTPRGTALVTIYKPVRHDLSAVGGAENGTVLESIVQEVDVETGRVLFDWRALDHVALAESHEEVPEEAEEIFDHFHVNSVDIDDDGNLLVSARHTDTVYKLDRRTGEVLWRLGGKRSDFSLGPGARFGAQHDARRQPDGTLTLFDNSNPPQTRKQSRAIRLRLDMGAMRATLVDAVRHPLGLSSDSQGNAQALPGGGMSVGWGSQPYLSWFTASGELGFGAHFPEDTDNYRAYRSPWVGSPPGRPAVSVDRAGAGGGGEPTVAASWNGATEVARWELLAGRSAAALQPVAQRPWTGFETVLRVPTGAERVAVRAVAASGRTLGTSDVVSVAR
jgi:hypothetical protein